MLMVAIRMLNCRLLDSAKDSGRKARRVVRSDMSHPVATKGKGLANFTGVVDGGGEVLGYFLRG
jgi:hypothetical protein